MVVVVVVIEKPSGECHTHSLTHTTVGSKITTILMVTLYSKLKILWYCSCSFFFVPCSLGFFHFLLFSYDITWISIHTIGIYYRSELVFEVPVYSLILRKYSLIPRWLVFIVLLSYRLRFKGFLFFFFGSQRFLLYNGIAIDYEQLLFGLYTFNWGQLRSIHP